MILCNDSSSDDGKENPQSAYSKLPFGGNRSGISIGASCNFAVIKDV